MSMSARTEIEVTLMSVFVVFVFGSLLIRSIKAYLRGRKP
jgi:ABC-type uncharacterized transport system permease subunit